MARFNTPFYFALRHTTPLETRQNALQHIQATFGVEGRVEHVRTGADLRLYRIVS